MSCRYNFLMVYYMQYTSTSLSGPMPLPSGSVMLLRKPFSVSSVSPLVSNQRIERPTAADRQISKPYQQHRTYEIFDASNIRRYYTPQLLRLSFVVSGPEAFPCHPLCGCCLSSCSRRLYHSFSSVFVFVLSFILI